MLDFIHSRVTEGAYFLRAFIRNQCCGCLITEMTDLREVVHHPPDGSKRCHDCVRPT